MCSGDVFLAQTLAVVFFLNELFWHLSEQWAFSIEVPKVGLSVVICLDCRGWGIGMLLWYRADVVIRVTQESPWHVCPGLACSHLEPWEPTLVSSTQQDILPQNFKIKAVLLPAFVILPASHPSLRHGDLRGSHCEWPGAGAFHPGGMFPHHWNADGDRPGTEILRQQACACVLILPSCARFPTQAETLSVKAALSYFALQLGTRFFVLLAILNPNQ